ncbi:MAG: TorF family putative porin [Betaproteobacteria bacterium]|jgi:uncharacterized protein (TIGR02001 family)
MNKTFLSTALTAAVLALGAAAPGSASAQTAAPEASPLTFNAGLVSEYRYRGISQTRFQPAVQGGADYAFANGFYLGAWASTIKWIKDAKGGADVELDLYGGYKGTLAEGLSYDVGALRYVYPSNGLKPSADTQEVYGAITAGAFTIKYSHATSNLFGFADSSGSGYLDVTASFDLGNGYMLAPHVGHQRVAGKGNGIYSYTDYALTLSKDFSGVVPSISLIGTDAQKGSYVAPNGKQLGRSGVVVGLKYNF